ncbi:UNVERIFIED_CONTAM: hypothetical protein FKN15_039624 [Acipenser sinensis]
MDRNALAELLQALESRRDAEERRREERYTALIEREGSLSQELPQQEGWATRILAFPGAFEKLGGDRRKEQRLAQ